MGLTDPLWASLAAVPVGGSPRGRLCGTQSAQLGTAWTGVKMKCPGDGLSSDITDSLLVIHDQKSHCKAHELRDKIDG